MRALLTALFVAVLSLVATTHATEREAVLVAQAKDAQIDINRAKADELMTLKGIGEARAAAIIKGTALRAQRRAGAEEDHPGVRIQRDQGQDHCEAVVVAIPAWS